MRSCQSLLIAFLVLAVLILSGNTFAAGPTEKVIYSFLGTPDGSRAESALVADAAGNLYGTTSDGGPDSGTVFELSPPATAGGAWTETILYSFPSGDGSLPGDGLIFDKLGNLYGTTSAPPNNTVFELSPPSTPGGAWTHTVIWTFSAYPGGSGVGGNLVMDANGNLYGTTYQLGTDGVGIVFELISPKTSGEHWTESVLYSFGAFAGDGSRPVDGLLLRGGVLYGATYYGGASGKGTVFQLVRKSGLWTEAILHSFAGGDGATPAAGVIADAAGNLYGTTSAGGGAACACGAVYELSPPAVAGDPWQETTLYSFTGGGDGGLPQARLWRNKLGKLYGTTLERGKGFGTVFEIKPPSVAGEAWSFVFIHDFSPSDGDGAMPRSGLTFLNGTLYGAAPYGGSNDLGAVYSVVP
jgi:uncharacterized repeat protein (TIGR03803 family)